LKTKTKRTILTLACVALLVGVTAMLSACGSDGIFSGIGDFFAKNYFSASKLTLRNSENIEVDGNKIKFIFTSDAEENDDGVFTLGSVVSVDMSKDKGLKFEAELLEAKNMAGINFVIILHYQDLTGGDTDEPEVFTAKYNLYRNNKAVTLPVKLVPSADSFKIVGYEFGFDGTLGEPVPFIQYKGITLKALSLA